MEIAPQQSALVHDWLARRLAHVDAGRSHLTVGHEDLAAWPPSRDSAAEQIGAARAAPTPMSRFDRTVGLLRSLAIYHAIPLRQRRLRRLYAGFVGRGDLVFDIGAHVGNRVRAFASLGCRVVAVEPQPDFAAVLRTLFARSAEIEIVAAAAGAAPGPGVAVDQRTHPDGHHPRAGVARRAGARPGLRSRALESPHRGRDDDDRSADRAIRCSGVHQD